jgi:S1-C subfamily serine protease
MRHLRSSVAALTLLAVPGLGLGPRLAAQDVDTADLYEKVVKSAVFIVTPLKGGAARGSGSLIDLDKKLVLTNYHVVDEADFVYVQFPQYTKSGQMITNPKTYMDNIPLGQAIKGTVRHRDKNRDLALVELEKVPAGNRAIPLAKDTPRQGTTVWNIGSPGAVEQLFSITEGKVRAVGVEEHKIGGGSEVLHLKAKLVYATNPTNPGDSGGPLFNKKGEQVAVTESGLIGAQQVNLFVDVTEVRAFLKQKAITIKESDDEPGKVVPKKGDDTGKPDPKKDNTNTAAKGPTPPAKDTDTTAAPSEADEKAAASLLSRAKLFAEGDENRKTYMDKLNAIIKQYPNTVAAKDAKKLLDGLK